MKRILIGLLIALFASSVQASVNILTDGQLLGPANDIDFIGGIVTGKGDRKTVTLGGGGSSYSAITQSGSNIGINTISPAATLEVNGNVLVDGTVYSTAGTFTGTVQVAGVSGLGVGTVSPRAYIEVGSGTLNHISGTNGVMVQGQMEIDSGLYVDGAIYNPSQAAISGSVTVCIDTNGMLIKKASACTGY